MVDQEAAERAVKAQHDRRIKAEELNQQRARDERVRGIVNELGKMAFLLGLLAVTVGGVLAIMNLDWSAPLKVMACGGIMCAWGVLLGWMANDG